MNETEKLVNAAIESIEPVGQEFAHAVATLIEFVPATQRVAAIDALVTRIRTWRAARDAILHRRA
jgi:hypothetical protein